MHFPHAGSALIILESEAEKAVKKPKLSELLKSGSYLTSATWTPINGEVQLLKASFLARLLGRQVLSFLGYANLPVRQAGV